MSSEDGVGLVHGLCARGLRLAVAGMLCVAASLGMLVLGSSPVAAVAFPDGDVPSGEATWVVSLRVNVVPGVWDPQPLCSGALVGPQLVVSAAHCLDGLLPEQVLVAAGGSPVASAPLTAVTGFSVHPRYLSRIGVYGVNDIALLRTASPVEGAVLQLPRSGLAADRLVQRAPGLALVGYGVDQNGVAADRPRFARVLDVSSVGRRFYPRFTAGSQMAVGVAHPGEGVFSGAVCAGDSGAPVVAQGRSGSVLVAVASFGWDDCAVPRPGFVMRAGYYVDWIRQQMAALVVSVPEAAMAYSDGSAGGLRAQVSSAGLRVWVPSEWVPGAVVELDTDFDGVAQYRVRSAGDGWGLVDAAGSLVCPVSSEVYDGGLVLAVPAGCVAHGGMADLRVSAPDGWVRLEGVGLL